MPVTVDLGTIEGGGFHRGGKVPRFTGGLEAFRNPRGRWDYGTTLGKYFSTLDVQAPPPQFPEVDVAYRDGSRLRELNVRPNLHHLDALLDDVPPDAEDVAEVLERLTERELAELRADAERLSQLRQLDDSAINEFLSQHGLAE